MLNSTLRRIRQARTQPATRPATVCVVDPQTDDYHAWQTLAEEHGLRISILATAAEALRFAHSQAVDLWVVNTHLPGLSGFELCSMLKNQSAHAAVYVVADEYSPEAERAAWQARATLFGCKPAQREWLQHFIQNQPLQTQPISGEPSCASRVG